MLPTFHKYLLHKFFWRLILAFGLILGLTITMDLIEQLDHINEVVKAVDMSWLEFTSQYYLYQLPVFFTSLLPVLMLIACGLTIIGMMRNQELIPFLSSGASTYQLLLPLFLSCLLGMLCTFLFQELVLPKISKKYASLQKLMSDGGSESQLLTGDGQGTYMKIKNISYTDGKADGISILQFHPVPRDHQNSSDQTKNSQETYLHSLTVAEKAKWMDTESNSDTGKWVLSNGERITYKVSGKRAGKPFTFGADELELKTTLSPDNIRSKETEVYFRSWNNLQDLAQKFPNIARIRVKIHRRLSYPFIALFLPLFAIPLLMTRQTESYWIGSFLMGGIALGFYLIHFLFLELGNHGTIHPVLACWIPIVLLVTLGLSLYDRIIT